MGMQRKMNVKAIQSLVQEAAGMFSFNKSEAKAINKMAKKASRSGLAGRKALEDVMDDISKKGIDAMDFATFKQNLADNIEYRKTGYDFEGTRQEFIGNLVQGREEAAAKAAEEKAAKAAARAEKQAAKEAARAEKKARRTKGKNDIVNDTAESVGDSAPQSDNGTPENPQENTREQQRQDAEEAGRAARERAQQRQAERQAAEGQSEAGGTPETESADGEEAPSQQSPTKEEKRAQREKDKFERRQREQVYENGRYEFENGEKGALKKRGLVGSFLHGTGRVISGALGTQDIMVNDAGGIKNKFRARKASRKAYNDYLRQEFVVGGKKPKSFNEFADDFANMSINANINQSDFSGLTDFAKAHPIATAGLIATTTVGAAGLVSRSRDGD